MITGFYETRIAYYSWRGAQGYRYASIPDYWGINWFCSPSISTSSIFFLCRLKRFVWIPHIVMYPLYIYSPSLTICSSSTCNKLIFPFSLKQENTIGLLWFPSGVCKFHQVMIKPFLFFIGVYSISKFISVDIQRWWGLSYIVNWIKSRTCVSHSHCETEHNLVMILLTLWKCWVLNCVSF